jgi:YVTN family beta-propeller protein
LPRLREEDGQKKIHFTFIAGMYNTLAVVSQSGQSVSFFDLESGKRTGHIENMIAEPHEIVYDRNSDVLYISHTYEHGQYWTHGQYAKEISVVNGSKKTIVDTIDVSPYSGPHGLELDTESQVIYISVEDGFADATHPGGIIAIDLKTHKIVKAIGSQYRTHWFVMTPDKKKAYTCNKDATFTSVLDVANEKMVGKIDSLEGTEQPGINKEGTRAYFPTPGLGLGKPPSQAPPAIDVIDTAADKVVRKIPMAHIPTAVHVTSQGKILAGQVIFDSSNPPRPSKGRLAVYRSEAEDYSLQGMIELDSLSLTISSSPDGRHAFVANMFAGTVSIIDTDTLEIKRTLEVDTVKRQDKQFLQGAHGLALLP